MNTLDDLLTRAMDDLGSDAPHQPDLAGLIRRKSRWRRVITVAPIAAALAVIAVIGTIVLPGPGGSGSAVPATPASACSPLTSSVLPTWARAGFSDPEPSMPWKSSHDGKLIAIVFAQPLISPGLPDRSNKILWAAGPKSSGYGTLTLTGTIEGGPATTTATVEGGPGPSIIDVPAPGCWHFDLAWGPNRDSIDLLYSPS